MTKGVPKIYTCPHCKNKGLRVRRLCENCIPISEETNFLKTRLYLEKERLKRLEKHKSGIPCKRCGRPSAWLWNDGYCSGTCREYDIADQKRRSKDTNYEY